ncbi:MAG: NUDIX hydrolase [Deltaproteobacteria bacterium]|nr:NUDIX hydrolase [Kofleriaceae bacterium]
MLFEIESDEIVGTGGFLALRRLRMRNRRADGSLSARYVCDFVVRPYGLDAVVVVVWHRRADGGVSVLVRDGLRPALYFGRDPATLPIPEAAPRRMLTELVAGIIEEGDRGEGGVRARAAAAVLEEAGFVVAADAVERLGAGSFPSAGSMPEKFHYVAVEVDPATQQPIAGDGSPMEEGAVTRWLDLDEAIAACVRGELEDTKTELGLRRLRDRLG